MNAAQKKKTAYGLLPVGYGLFVAGTYLFVFALSLSSYIWAAVCIALGACILWITWKVEPNTMKWFFSYYKKRQ